jgi:nitronate monooxygenase
LPKSSCAKEINIGRQAKLDIVKKLGLRGPLIQGPMSGGPASPELVAAVSNAGALGSIGGAYQTPQELIISIEKVKALTNSPFAVNLFISSKSPLPTAEKLTSALVSTRPFRHLLGLPEPLITPPYEINFDDQFEVILKNKPTVFSFTFGIPTREVLKSCQKHDILSIGTATCVEEALQLEEAGVSAIVAQGSEAGGHQGTFDESHSGHFIKLKDLTQMLNLKIKIPLIAAGGIMNGTDISDVLSLGASAAQLGTAFLICPESGTNSAYRAAFNSRTMLKTKLTRAFSGRWARGIENQFMREIDRRAETILPYPAQNVLTRDIRKKSAELGKAEFLSLWAGEGLASIRTMPAGELVKTLLNEFQIAELKRKNV